jgi:two-component system sensor histidine kinase EvgS
MRTHVVRWLVLFVLAMAMGMQASAASSPPLPAHQSEWLGRHPTIILGMYDSGWPPFESMRDGTPVGLGYDYLSLLTRQLGVQVQVRMYRDWTDVLEAACRGEVDVVMNITLTADRTRCMVYTRPYAQRQWRWWAAPAKPGHRLILTCAACAWSPSASSSPATKCAPAFPKPGA